MKLLLISVGRGRYAVAADAVTRILDPERQPDFRREGGGGDAIERGVRYPVLDLHAAAGETPGPSCVYLMVEGRGGRAVLPVDSAEAIREVAASAIAPLPSFIFASPKRLFRGIFSDGLEPRLLLDVDGLS
ncbi:MAG: hypothetical protein DMF50_00235 [Acidobacteria bacterium]|nr:MAG: hypothetical protein DMF50_00235 [Acidobacteriota bacterium]